MKIRYLAHASFLITAENGTRIITDPYKSGNGFNYAPVTEAAEIVTVSHEHGDHNYVETVTGSPNITRDGGIIEGIALTTVKTAHDAEGGNQRGANTIFIMDIEGMKVVHLGDLGHPLTPEHTEAIGDVDVLLIPVGGFFTIDATIATETASQLNAKVVIPMHFKTEICGLPINEIDPFISGKTNVRRSGASEVTLTKDSLPSAQEIIVLEPSH